MPVLARAGQPRHLQAQHQPHMAHREFCDQPREPGPLGRIRGRPPQVLIDHHHPGRRPAQRDRPVYQPVLQPRRLAVVHDLLARRLPDVDDRQPVTLPALDLALAELTQAHRAHLRSPPPPARPRPPSRSRSMPSSPRMSFRVASGNDAHSSPSGTLVAAVIWRRCPRPRRPRRSTSRAACPQLPSPLHQPEQPLPADKRCANSRLSNDPCTMTNRLRASGRCSNGPGQLRRRQRGRPGRIVKRKLKKIQYRPDLIDGCLAETGLTIEPW